MDYFYKDTDLGNDGNTGLSWAQAFLTQEALNTAMTAGDIGVVKGVAEDAGATRLQNAGGTAANWCRFIGVKPTTTNEGDNIVESDLAVAGSLPVIRATSSGNDISFYGFNHFSNFYLHCQDKLQFDFNTTTILTNCKLVNFDDANVIFGSTGEALLILNNCEYDRIGSNAGSINVDIEMNGGFLGPTYFAELVNQQVKSCGYRHLTGVDLTVLDTHPLIGGTGGKSRVILKSCLLPPTVVIFNSPPIYGSSCEIIGSRSTDIATAADSAPDYLYEDINGSIDGEFTVVRTSGADDGASGGFSYAMTPKIDSTNYGAHMNDVCSPIMSAWVDGGSNTITVFIANSSASTKYLENEVYLEVYSANSDMSTQYTQTFSSGDRRLLFSTTTIADDVDSTWGAGGNVHQKISVALTTGYSGRVYIKLHLTKRSATPDTLYLDPRPVVS